MASRFWEFVANAVAGAFARAEHINEKFEEVDNALLLVANELNRCIRFTSGIPDENDFQLAQTTAQRANLVLGFDANGMPQLRSFTFSWRDDWEEGAAYAVNDTVRAPDENFNSVYICIQAHTAGASFSADLAAGRWAVLVDLEPVHGAVKRFKIIDDDYTAQAGDDLFVDTAVGPVVITLPATPTIDDQPITIIDLGSASSNIITIARNGNRINGLESNLTISSNNGGVELQFASSGLGWRLIRVV